MPPATPFCKSSPKMFDIRPKVVATCSAVPNSSPKATNALSTLSVKPAMSFCATPNCPATLAMSNRLNNPVGVSIFFRLSVSSSTASFDKPAVLATSRCAFDTSTKKRPYCCTPDIRAVRLNELTANAAPCFNKPSGENASRNSLLILPKVERFISSRLRSNCWARWLASTNSRSNSFISWLAVSVLVFRSSLSLSPNLLASAAASVVFLRNWSMPAAAASFSPKR